MSVVSRAATGTYALLFTIPRTCSVHVGGLGRIELRCGTGLYVGSAFGSGGLVARLRHHLLSASTPRWHLDYLRRAIRPEEIWFTCDPRSREHLWAGVFAAMRAAGVPRDGFGASDCRCRSHLFHFATLPRLAAFRRAVRRRAPDHDPIATSAP